MGERKVLNKYIPADFDPKLVPRGKKPKDDLIPVRMMLPFSIQCQTCSTFLYRGRKFNSKKEPVKGINGKYLGIQRFRFYIKCSDCARPITFLTDPKNADYEMESGGTRNYEVWHDENKTNAEHEKQLEEDEKLDSMKALENRVAESQREMAEMDALEEIQAMNKRHVSLMKGGRKMDAAEAVLKAREAAVGKTPEDEVDLNEHGITKEEEDLVCSIKFGASSAAMGSDGPVIRRLDEEDELLAEKQRREESEALMTKQLELQNTAKEGKQKKSNMPIFKVKRKKKKTTDVVDPEPKRVKTDTAVTKKPEPPKSDSDSDNGGGALGGLLADYGSDSS